MPEEFNLINAPLEGSNLIEASAGTGKTFTIAGIYLRLIAESGLRVEEILVVTFTIAATEELRRRIRGKLKSAREALDGINPDDEFIKEYLPVLENISGARQRIVNALKSFDEASVYTIHSFCQQVLADNAFESGSLYNIEIASDRDGLLKALVNDFWRKRVYTAPDYIARYFIEKTGPPDMLELYKRKPLDPSARLKPYPSKPDMEKLENLYRDLESRFVKLKESWAENRDCVLDILKNSPALNRTIYKKTSADSMAEKMSTYLKGDDPVMFPDVTEKFTAAKISASTVKGGTPPESPFFLLCDSFHEAAQETGRMLENFLLYTRHELFEYIDMELARLKEEKQERGFDDLIRDVHRAVTGPRGDILGRNVAGRYSAALIDEFQDTDQLQFEIFRRLFNDKKCVLFLIGDPKQAIYRFRGADVFSYIDASMQMEKSYTLLNNWRSRPELIGAVNTLFHGCENPFRFKEIGFSPVRAGDENQAEIFYRDSVNTSGMDFIISSGTNSDEVTVAEGADIVLESIAAEISEIADTSSGRYRLGERNINPGDIAVLVRTNELAGRLRSRLRRLNVPSVIQGGETVFSTQEAMELFYIAAAAAEPGSERALKAAVSTDIFGIRADDFPRLTSGEGTSRFESFDEISGRFFYYREIWQTNGIMSMLKELIAEENVEERLFSSPEGERRITNIYHMIELLHRAEKSSDLAVQGLLSWFRSAVTERPADDEYLTRLERDDYAVKILTVHSSKGLEFPVVFCPLIPEGDSSVRGPMIFHDREDSNRTVMYLDSSTASVDEKEQYKAENFSENVRLVYVALTRAKSKCFVYTAKTVKNFTSSTPFALFYKLRNDIGEKTDAPSFSDYCRALEKIAASSGGKIKFQILQRKEGKAYSGTAEKTDIQGLSAREFTGKIRDDWRIWSYSALARGDESEGRDRDRDTFPSEETVTPEKESIFTFPSGPGPGLLMHEIFENIDFTWPAEKKREIILTVLSKYGFDEKFSLSVEGMVENVINTELGSDGVRLQEISADKRLNELEFYFPVKSRGVEDLKKVFLSHGSPDGASRGITDFSSLRGFLKGFIDLIFLYKGKYYIADWKSNNLGNGYEFYSMERINGEMEVHNYFLQYHIYSLALHRYLRMRLGSDYNYERDFGGVYYLFVRGINPEYPGMGVFFDRPDISLVEELDKFFMEGV